MPRFGDVSRRALLKAAAAAIAVGRFVGKAHAAHSPEMEADLEDEFTKRGATGTFVHLDVETDRILLVSPARAQKRLIPASTFKIANALIALETGAVADEDTLIPWGGTPQPDRRWERDMSIREALPLSNVPVFQEIARRVGVKQYESWLDRLGYGNATVGTNVERFWLDGPLTISAIEQTSFLAALSRAELPSNPEIQRRVCALLHVDRRDGRDLFAKTGWCQATDPQIGWWVGWVQSEKRQHAFALNMDIASPDDLTKRVEIGRAILSRLGIY